MAVTPLTLVLVGSCLLLVVGSFGYKRGTEDTARLLSTTGFGLLSVVVVVLVIGYASGTESTEYFWLIASVLALGMSLQATTLTYRGWERASQLTVAAAVLLVVLVPFELVPPLELALKEVLTQQFAVFFGWLGIHAVVEPSVATGELHRLGFANGANITIDRDCTGVDAIALFSGLVIAARTTWQRKLLGIGVVLLAVWLVNTARILFVGAAMAGDWFGPLVGASNTLEVTYVIAEVAIGQTFVVVAAVVGFLYLSRLLPDVQAFVTELVGTVRRPFEG